MWTRKTPEWLWQKQSFTTGWNTRFGAIECDQRHVESSHHPSCRATTYWLVARWLCKINPKGFEGNALSRNASRTVQSFLRDVLIAQFIFSLLATCCVNQNNWVSVPDFNRTSRMSAKLPIKSSLTGPKAAGPHRYSWWCFWVEK